MSSRNVFYPCPSPMLSIYQGILFLTRGVYPIIYRDFTKGFGTEYQSVKSASRGRGPDDY
jgi:hypothetical protein